MGHWKQVCQACIWPSDQLEATCCGDQTHGFYWHMLLLCGPQSLVSWKTNHNQDTLWTHQKKLKLQNFVKNSANELLVVLLLPGRIELIIATWKLLGMDQKSWGKERLQVQHSVWNLIAFKRTQPLLLLLWATGGRGILDQHQSSVRTCARKLRVAMASPGQRVPQSANLRKVSTQTEAQLPSLARYQVQSIAVVLLVEHAHPQHV